MSGKDQRGTDHWHAALSDRQVQTPAYVYAMDEMAEQMRGLSRELGTPIVSVVAACSNPDVLSRRAEDVRFGARCASRFEMNLVSGWKSDHLYVGMPAMDSVSARAALGGRFRIVIDSPAQLETLVQLRGARQLAPTILSLHSSLLGGDTDRKHLLGMDRAALDRALELALRESVVVGGLHMYAGRRSFGSRGLQVARCLAELAPAVEQKLGYALQEINLGGGLEEDWWLHGHDFAEYRRALEGFAPHLKLMHELGRSVQANAGAFLTRVVAVKTLAGQTVAVCDGGRVQALGLASPNRRWRGGALLLQRDREVMPLAPSDSHSPGSVVCGATAGEDDVLARVAERLRVGDVLAFTGAGAYMQTLSPTQYLGFAQAQSYVRT